MKFRKLAGSHAGRIVLAAVPVAVVSTVLMTGVAQGAVPVSFSVSGSQFQILLPLADLDDLSSEPTEDLLRDLRGAIVGISRRGRTLVPRVGMARYPEDASSLEDLEGLTSARRWEDDPYAHPIEVPGRPHTTSRIAPSDAA